MSVCFYYFSGTGYTKWLVGTAIEQIKKAGGKIKGCYDMATEELPAEEPEGAVGLMQREALSDLVVVIPVYFWGLPAKAVKQMNKMPYVAGRKVALWVTSAGYPAYAPYQAVGILKDRGYVVSDIQRFKMPDTFLPLASSQEKGFKITQKLAQAQQQVEAALPLLSKTEPVVEKKSLLSCLTIPGYYVMYFTLRHCLGFSFMATERCNRCRWCVRNCPVGCISMKHSAPEWSVGCTMCFRCVNGCPVQAIEMSWLSFVFGLAGAFFSWGLLYFSLAFLGSAFLSLLTVAVLPFGYLAGVLGFQKAVPFLLSRLKLERTYLLTSKKRVQAPQKDLPSLLKEDMMPSDDMKGSLE